ncbi:MAG: metallophosphoesterase family protein [Candidatus Omnitrophota bacterium]
MKIGVISDTHIPVTALRLPDKVYSYFKSCDLIVHAGDATEESVIEELRAIAETKAVCGNMDSFDLKKKLPKKIVFKVGNKEIGVMHGSGPPFKVMQNVAKEFSPKPDIIIFGHTHIPMIDRHEGVLFFNPGSATDSVCSKCCSFGIIEINGDDIKAEIVEC